MSSFRPTQADLDNISKIIIDRGGISKTEAIRAALHEAATNEPKLAIKPQLPPIHEVQKVISTLNCFVGELRNANRIGWPEHMPGESAERTDKVIEARSRNEAAFAEFTPRLEQMRLLIRAVMTCKEFDVSKLKDAIDYMYIRYKYYMESLKKPELSPNTNIIYNKMSKSLKVILDFFAAVGIFTEKIP